LVRRRTATRACGVSVFAEGAKSSNIAASFRKTDPPLFFSTVNLLRVHGLRGLIELYLT
jgi:hypothetical protein